MAGPPGGSPGAPRFVSPPPARTLQNLAVLALSLTLVSWTPAQSPLDDAGPLAINLDEFRDWNPTWAFTDAMKQARPFVSQPIDSVQPFDDGQFMATDAVGWPLPVAGQAAASLLWSELDGNYPAGTYDLYWEGSGQIVLGLDASFSYSVEPGHDRYNVAPTYEGILIKILASNPYDPIRNIRLMMPGFANEATAPTFHPDFLSELEPFDVVRVMQWQNINFTTVENWWERPTPGDATQATSLGVSAEYLVELGNVTGKALWMCIPRLATDDYVREFARFVATNLNPEVPVYLEWANEVWNGAFFAYWYALAQGQAAGLPGTDFAVAMTWYSERSLEVFEIWRQEFELVSGAGWRDRLVRVIGSQHDNPFVAGLILDHQNAFLQCDALATAPYFGSGFGEATPADVAATIAMSEAEILAELEAEVLGPLRDRVQGNTLAANQRGLPHIAYEAGQHLVPTGGFFANQDLSAKFVAVNRDPGMYDLYRKFLDVWEEAGGGLMTPYSLATRFSTYGSFGHLEYLGQPLSEAHKMRAVLDWAGEVPGTPPAVHFFGQGCDGLQISYSGSALAGSTDFSVDLTGAGRGQRVRLALGFETLSPPTGSSNLAISLALDPGCQGLVSPTLGFPALADGDGKASLSMPLPDVPSLMGTSFYFQWSAFGNDPMSLATGLSGGLSVVLGG